MHPPDGPNHIIYAALRPRAGAQRIGAGRGMKADGMMAVPIQSAAMLHTALIENEIWAVL